MVAKKKKHNNGIVQEAIEALTELPKQRRIWAAIVAGCLVAISILNGELASTIGSGMIIGLNAWSYFKPK